MGGRVAVDRGRIPCGGGCRIGLGAVGVLHRVMAPWSSRPLMGAAGAGAPEPIEWVSGKGGGGDQPRHLTYPLLVTSLQGLSGDALDESGHEHLRRRGRDRISQLPATAALARAGVLVVGTES